MLTWNAVGRYVLVCTWKIHRLPATDTYNYPYISAEMSSPLDRAPVNPWCCWPCRGFWGKRLRKPYGEYTCLV